MYNADSFTKKANTVINKAFLQAGKLGHTYVGSEHILLSLISEQGAGCVGAFRMCGVTERQVLDKITEIVGRGDPCVVSEDAVTPAAREIMDAAALSAAASGSALAGTEHLLSALLDKKDCTASIILSELGGRRDGRNIYDRAPYDRKSFGEVKVNALSDYARDLTAEAAEKGFDPVVGREKETERVIRILARLRG
jgi:ATP-dependent Clp protease ATP-binding subunit ClpC